MRVKSDAMDGRWMYVYSKNVSALRSARISHISRCPKLKQIQQIIRIARTLCDNRRFVPYLSDIVPYHKQNRHKLIHPPEICVKSRSIYDSDYTTCTYNIRFGVLMVSSG